MLTGARAREETFRSAVGGKAVLHVATHGILRDEDPLGSFLALGGSGSVDASDGRLTAQEIYGLRLEADLVVLRAGRIKVTTAAGPVPLPEHPAFWASFVLQGEP